MSTTIRVSDYSGGLNTTSAAESIERNQASLLRNWDITYAGQLRRRDGTQLIGDKLAARIDGGVAYTRSTGGKDVLVMAGGELWYLDGTFKSLDNGFTAVPTDMVVCPLNDRVYISNETDVQHYWDRGSTIKNSSLTALAATIPHGNVLRWHKNHMFTINAVNVNGTKYYQRLYWSNIGDPGTWTTASDYIDIPGGGNAITIGDLGNALVIFKEHSVSFLTGWGSANWKITASASNTAGLDESVGCIAPKGHTRVGNELWFIDDEGSIRRIYQTDFDAFRSDIISNKIQGTIATINKAQLSKAIAFTWNDKVFFSVATGSSTENNTTLVFDIKAYKRNLAAGSAAESWTTYTGWTPTVFFDYPTSVAPDMYIGDSTGKVMNHTGESDCDVVGGNTVEIAIDARWDGKIDGFDKPELYKGLRFGFITGLVSSPATVGIYSSADRSAFGKLGDLVCAPVGGTLGPTGTFALGPTGKTAILGGLTTSELEFKFSDGGGSVTVKSNQMSIRHAVVSEQPIVNGFEYLFDYYEIP